MICHMTCSLKSLGTKLVVLLIFVLAWWQIGYALDAVDQQRLRDKATAIKSARRKLLKLPINRLDDRLSPRAISSIGEMKTTIQRLVNAYVASLPTNALPDINKIERALKRRVRIANTSATTVANNIHYGSEVWFEVRIAKDARRLLSIKSSFSIQCGSDSILQIFEPSETGWRQVINWQSRPYSEIYGALNSFQFTISPPDPLGNWYLLGSDMPARCSSCWGMQNYYILRPGSEHSKPNVLLKNHLISYQCDEASTLSAHPESFDISYQGRDRKMEDLIRRLSCHYELKSGNFFLSGPASEKICNYLD